jgi:hypothetical protein
MKYSLNFLKTDEEDVGDCVRSSDNVKHSPFFENNLTVCQYGQKKKGLRAKLPKRLSCYARQVFIHLYEVSQVKYFSCFLCILWNLY